MQLKWPRSPWAIQHAQDYNEAELNVLEFARAALSPVKDMEIRRAQANVTDIICDCPPGHPCHGEVFLHKAVAMEQATRRGQNGGVSS